MCRSVSATSDAIQDAFVAQIAEFELEGHFSPHKGFSAIPPQDQRLWLAMHQAAEVLHVSDMVVRKLIAQKILPAKQIVKVAVDESNDLISNFPPSDDIFASSTPIVALH
jgi:hypothetical protein